VPDVLYRIACQRPLRQLRLRLRTRHPPVKIGVKLGSKRCLLANGVAVSALPSGAAAAVDTGSSADAATATALATLTALAAGVAGNSAVGCGAVAVSVVKAGQDSRDASAGFGRGVPLTTAKP
jgi:hypothetical protein